MSQKYISLLDVCCILFIIINTIIISVYKHTTDKCGVGKFTLFDINILYNILNLIVIIINRFIEFHKLIHIIIIFIQLILGIFYALIFFIGCYNDIPFSFGFLYYFIILSIISYIVLIMYEVRIKFKYGFVDDNSDKPLLIEQNSDQNI